MGKSKVNAEWMPARQDIIWINCNAQARHEMPDTHPFLVLSPRHFNAQTSLVIRLLMNIAEYNGDNPFAVNAGNIKAKTGKTSYLLCYQPKFFDWRVLQASPHPMRKLQQSYFAEACSILEQIIQLTGPKDSFCE
jgi:mRNA interferase MazF